MSHPLHHLHWLARMGALQRQGLALSAALLTGIATSFHIVNDEVVFLVAWLAYCAVLLSAIWPLSTRLDAQATRWRAQVTDPGAVALFVVVATACCASIVAVALAIDTAKGFTGWIRWIHLALAMLSLGASWLLMQAMFALHYARVFYRPQPTLDAPARGLVFPGGKDPDYLDFLYFSAVVGMTSQVSDIAVAGRSLRKLTLMHGLLSFAFNLVVLALAVNVLAGSLG